MAYVSHIQLAERPGAQELAQVATDRHKRIVDSALMDATLRAADRSEWEPEDVAEADAALQRIDDAVADADGLINGYLRKRGYPVPISPVPRIVTAWSRDIARYFLHQDRLSSEGNDPIVRAYRDALKLLQQLADGTFSLGADDDLTTTAGMPEFRKGATPVRDALQDY